MSNTVVEIKNLSVSFLDNNQPVRALSSINLSIEPGETLALLGESGCGKSLTAYSLMQLLPNNAFVHQESSLLYQGKNLFNQSEQDWQRIRGREFAMIFQEPMTSLNPVLSIGYQLSEAVNRVGPLKGHALNDKLLSLLDLVELKDKEKILRSYPHQLSGGQKQRIMIAMALASNPSLLIADEPTTALDVSIEAQILNLIKKLQQKLNMAVLLITHDLSVVRRVASKLVVMYAGEVVERGDVGTLLTQPKHPYTKELLKCLPSYKKRGSLLESIEGIVPMLSEMPKGCRFKSRCYARMLSCEQHPPLIPLDEDHFVRCQYYLAHSKDSLPQRHTTKRSQQINLSSEICLHLEDISVDYEMKKTFIKKNIERFNAVSDVSLSISKGETVAVVGESGCGKTTLAKAICGLIPMTKGKIHYNGTLLVPSKKRDLSIQMVFQDPFSSMNPRMLVEDILLEGLIQKKNLSMRAREKAVFHLLDMVGMSKQSAYRYPHQFSGGQRQRLAIARALSMQPKLLICDEPTSALDVSVQAQVLNLLKSLQEELNLSYLFITHDMNVVSYLADNVYVMDGGQVVDSGDINYILHASMHPKTNELTAIIRSN